jgi:translation initiation factor IF-1
MGSPFVASYDSKGYSGGIPQTGFAVCCENHTERTNPVRTSQETRKISATVTNRLIMFKKTVAVYCENHTERTNPVRTLQETHYVSVSESSRLMLFTVSTIWNIQRRPTL